MMLLQDRIHGSLGLWRALWILRRLRRKARRLDLGLARLQVILPGNGEDAEAGYESAVTDLGLRPRRVHLVLCRRAGGDPERRSAASPRVILDLLTRPGASLPVLFRTDFFTVARARAAGRAVSCQLVTGPTAERETGGVIRLSLFQDGGERDRLEIRMPASGLP
ncbi:MAG: hypothetical protein ACE5ID_09600 [Acidobacteriota bacterium]